MTGSFNALDRAIAWFAPATAARRAHYRRVLAYYEAADPSRLRKGRTSPGTGNLSVMKAGRALREQARYLEQNHDLARGVLNDLVNKVVGPNGIGIEPQPRTAANEIHELFAEQIVALWKDWCYRPEVTWQHDWVSCQRLVARSWLRDGETFTQLVQGTTPYLNHGTLVPMSLEMIEADLVPFEYSLPPTITMGVEVNAWGRSVAYWVLLQPPGDTLQGFAIVPSNLKRVSADRILHLALRDRIRQFRGVSVFASVLQRFDDLKDYEESERVAAKVAASMAAYIKKGTPDDYTNTPTSSDEPEQRQLKFRAGMVFDDLRPGEDIGTIDTRRPSSALDPFRDAMLRAGASGVGASFSSIAKKYDGTYSAQRQEMVESFANYEALSNAFTSRFVCPVYEAFIATAIAAGALKVPADVLPQSVGDAIYIPPRMPWIDPEAETNADILAEGSCIESGPQIIRRRGGNPRDVIAQEAAWRKRLAAAGIAQNLNAQVRTPSVATPAGGARRQVNAHSGD